MKAATYTQGSGFEVREVAQPTVGPGELLLQIRTTALCGTDLKIATQGHRRLQNGQRIVLGHEIVGDIVDKGAGSNGFDFGQRVGIAPNAGCGVCRTCARGEANYCEQYTAFGIDRDGSHAAYMNVPSVFVRQGNVIPLPDTVSDLAATLLEPLSCVVNALRAVEMSQNDRVVIFGAGPMGLLHVLACRNAGAASIIVADPQPDRVERALALGADLGVDPAGKDLLRMVREASAGEGADVVITACPVAEAQQDALSLLAIHGRLCLFGGLPQGSGAVPMDTNAIHYRNLTVTGTTGGSVCDYRAALELVVEGRVDPTAVISDTLSLDDLDMAYQTALNGATGKVVMVASR